MISNFLWIFLLILQCGIVTPRSTPNRQERDDGNFNTHHQYDYEAQNKPKDDNGNEDQVISVRITSSVAVGRSGPRTFSKNHKPGNNDLKELFPTTPSRELNSPISTKNDEETVRTEIPPNLIGANIEFIRQLNAKKEAKSHLSLGNLQSPQLSINRHNIDQTATPIEEAPSHQYSKLNGEHLKNNEKNRIQIFTTTFRTPLPQYNHDDDSLAEPSIKSVLGIGDEKYDYEHIDSLPLVREEFKMPSHIQVNKIKDGPSFSQIDTLDQNNYTEDTIAASSSQSISTVTNRNESDDNIENIPLARSLPFSSSSKNYIQGLTNKTPSERGNSPSLTTVSFDIVHDTPKQTPNYNAQSNSNQGIETNNKLYEPPKVYSQPAQIYSEPAKFYSEPAKIYSEPAKVYSEPAKVYSEPAKIYSEPAKFYSPPASLNLPPEPVPNPWQDPTPSTDNISTVIITTPTTIDTIPPETVNTQRVLNQQPEKNYEVDEKVSVLTDGRSHGVQETSTEKCKQDNCKVGYVVEGRQYKKYRVEERTPDGFIVGEYGVVRNEDGALRGVRYTADSDASPRLIYDALMKFLQLK